MDKFLQVRRELLLLLSFYSFTASAQTASLEGRVLDEQTSKPVPGVLVKITGTAFLKETDAEGHFSFSGNLPLGEQLLEFSRSTYFTKRYPVIISEEQKNLKTIYLKPDLLEVQQQTAVISLSDQELDEEDGGYVNVSGLLQASRDIFLNAAAFDFSPAFFRPRGYDSQYSTLLINGVEMNKFFNGRPQWSNWGGLNDVQRNQVFSRGLDPSDVAFGSIAGTTNIIMRASEYAPGGKISLAAANRAYSGRLMGSYHTGMNEAGWAFSVSVARRFAEESYIEGSIYDANSFFASVEKKFSEAHSLNFTGFYTPNIRGKNSPNTREVYDLKGNRYNSYWGLQEGEIRNSRIRKIQEPVFMLNHIWKFSDRTSLNTNLAYQFGKVGNSRIDYGGSRLVTGPNGEEIFVGGGSNPDPAYYQKMPSYFLQNTTDPDYRSAYLAQEDFLADGQLDWQALYLANQTSMAAGGNALYVLYEDRSDDRQLSASSILLSELNTHLTLNAALNFRVLESDNFANVLDLFGVQAWLDVDSFSEGSEAQNNLLTPNRLVGEDDRFKYSYELSAETVDSFAQLQYFSKTVDSYVGAEAFYTRYLRNGLYQNGNFPENSLGKSELLDFWNYGIKSGLVYKFSGRHILDLDVGYFTKPPTLQNSFSNSRQNNLVVQNLESENVTSIDLGYIFRSSFLKGRITGFYGNFQDGTELSFYFADGISGLGRGNTTAFVQEVLTGIDRRHLGVEFGFEVPVTSTLKLKAAGSIGEYIYSSNPRLYLTSDDFTETRELGKSFLRNYHVPGGPQRVGQIGFEYRDPDYWWIASTFNYFSHAFIDVAPLTRTKNFVTDADELPIVDYDPGTAKNLLQQEQLDDYTLLNLVGGKSWRLKDKYVGVFFSINNLLDSEYVTGGYEQSRNVNYTLLKEDRERENALFGPKYWFGLGTTYYAHVYLRF
ncbi:CarboxypepD_reg-like domain-containing protein [Salinimicrobium catena]|uniref:CarboxypepD_reg-like domain-containing protein n=1 Tax=Salinimicrobium catena TaxID=390640 RepID=A0A1H5J9I3_9FLAO|nr:carboxypeptidase-like regulatory domain-containing protein [Salinimicrobium catena]SDK84883.1 CarboxypepD_reg-like domain-containing protein [Salinimicrobium catena]SEE48268.1 CarboxypepD_reg-like domain-containing protein [Salinimicrobium catena]